MPARASRARQLLLTSTWSDKGRVPSTEQAGGYRITDAAAWLDIIGTPHILGWMDYHVQHQQVQDQAHAACMLPVLQVRLFPWL